MGLQEVHSICPADVQCPCSSTQASQVEDSFQDQGSLDPTQRKVVCMSVITVSRLWESFFPCYFFHSLNS